jgi:hypothetical protein
MQIRFNIWPGDASFGGVFDPSILPVYLYVDWVQYSSYTNGTFELAWREDFTADTAPAGWIMGNWDSPKGLSTHSPNNVSFADGNAILALTDDAGQGTGGTTSGIGGAAPGTGGDGALQTGGSAAAGDSPFPPPASDEAGCDCHVAAARPRNALGIGLLLGTLLVGCTRRRKKAKPIS